MEKTQLKMTEILNTYGIVWKPFFIESMAERAIENRETKNEFLVDVMSYMANDNIRSPLKIKNLNVFKKKFQLEESVKELPDWYFEVVQLRLDYTGNVFTLMFDSKLCLIKLTDGLTEQEIEQTQKDIGEALFVEYQFKKMFNPESAHFEIGKAVMQKILSVTRKVNGNKNFKSLNEEIKSLLNQTYDQFDEK